MIQQQCTGPCGAWLPLVSFGFRKATGKHYPRCKRCLADAARDYRQHPTNRDRLKQQERERSAARRDYITTWQEQHAEQVAATQVARRQAAKAAREQGHAAPH